MEAVTPKQNMKTVVIIPALNEEASIGQVIDKIPTEFRQWIVVADNGSTDRTAEVARSQGAEVVRANRRGYGSACLAGLAHVNDQADIVMFLDADYSDYPEDLREVHRKLIDENLDLVIGSRTRGAAEPGALLPQARYGNWLATSLMNLRFHSEFTDLGPMRAIRREALQKIQMRDPDFGWTMEMQVKALRHGLSTGEVSVRYRKRVGVSKITGTVKGTVLAGTKILWTLARYGL